MQVKQTDLFINIQKNFRKENFSQILSLNITLFECRLVKETVHELDIYPQNKSQAAAY